MPLICACPGVEEISDYPWPPLAQQCDDKTVDWITLSTALPSPGPLRLCLRISVSRRSSTIHAPSNRIYQDDLSVYLGHGPNENGQKWSAIRRRDLIEFTSFHLNSWVQTIEMKSAHHNRAWAGDNAWYFFSSSKPEHFQHPHKNKTHLCCPYIHNNPLPWESN